MHPLRSEHACFLHILAAAVLLGVGLVGAAGCTSAPPRPDAPFVPSDTLASTVDRDSALAVLTQMRRTAFDSAFATLRRYSVTRYVRTEQMTPTGTTTAVRSYVLRYPRGREPGTIQRRDSAGAFRDGGLLGRAAPSQAPTARPANVAAQALPDQPAYVEPRTREAFRYALHADTLGAGTPVYVLAVRARAQGTGPDQGIRYARLLVDRRSDQLIGLALVRNERGLLFSEQSQMSIRLRPASIRSGPAPEPTWVPDVTRVRAQVHVPFRAPRQFRTVSAFYGYDPS